MYKCATCCFPFVNNFVTVFAYIMIGQFRAESLEERERGVGLGKVLKLGFELGMPIAQRCCMLRTAHKAIGADQHAVF